MTKRERSIEDQPTMRPFVTRAASHTGPGPDAWYESRPRTLTPHDGATARSLDAVARVVRAMDAAQFETAYLRGDLLRALEEGPPDLRRELASLRASGARGTNLHAAAYALVREHMGRRGTTHLWN